MPKPAFRLSLFLTLLGGSWDLVTTAITTLIEDTSKYMYGYFAYKRNYKVQ